MTTVNGQGITYQEFEDRLHAAGIKTTSINEGKEANFADYGNALSDDLKQQILDSFDCEQDYQLQSMIADLYNDNKSVLQSGQFVNACKNMGLSVNISYQKTSYISDYKAGNFDNSVSTGSIAVYTISDGMGGEIKIADANGNGALESEEIFMNQILGDINYEISVKQGTSAEQLGVGSSGYTNGNEEGEEEVSQVDFNSEVESFIKQGFTKEDAIDSARFSLNADGMDYSGGLGDFLEKLFVSEDDKNSDTEIIKEESEMLLNLQKELDKIASNNEDKEDTLKSQNLFAQSKEIEEEIEKENIFEKEIA